MSTNKTDRSHKTLLNKRTTSEAKAVYEEVGDNTINVHNDEIWAETIAYDDPAQAISNGVAEQRTLFVLTEDVSVANSQAWYAEAAGTRLKDWISDKYGNAYDIKLYDNDDNEIFPTDALDWFWDYTTGILTINGNALSKSHPFKVTGYRYVGSKGASGSGVSGIDIQDEGVSVNLLAKKLDFAGSGVTATQDGYDSDLVNISIPGGGSGSALNLPWKSARFFSGARESLIRSDSSITESDKLIAYPIPVPSSTPIDQLVLSVTPANSNPFPAGTRIRLALFSDNVGRPGTLIAATEVEFDDTVLTGSFIVLLEGSIAEITLSRGFVWFAYIANAGAAPDAVRYPVVGAQLGRLGSLAISGQRRIDELTFTGVPEISSDATEILRDVEGNEVSFAWIAATGNPLPSGVDVGIVIPALVSETALAFRDAVNNPVTPKQTAVSEVSNDWTIGDPSPGEYGVTVEDVSGVQKDFEYVQEGGSPATPGAFGVEVARSVNDGQAAEALVTLEAGASAGQTDGTTIRIPDGYNGTEVTFEFEITPGSADPANVAVSIGSEDDAGTIINALQDAINNESTSRADWDVAAAEPSLDTNWSMAVSLEGAGAEGNNPLGLTQPVAAVWGVSGFEGGTNGNGEVASGFVQLNSGLSGNDVHGNSVTIQDGNHGVSVRFQFVAPGGTPDPGLVGVEVAGTGDSQDVMNALSSAIGDYADSHANWNITSSDAFLVNDGLDWRISVTTQADGTSANQAISNNYSEVIEVDGFSGGADPFLVIDNDQTAQNLADAIDAANAGDSNWNVTAIRSANIVQLTAGDTGVIPGGTFVFDLNAETNQYTINVISAGSAGVALPLNVTATDEGGDAIRLTWDSEGELTEAPLYLQPSIYEAALIQSGIDPIPTSIETVEPAGVAAARPYGAMPSTFPAVDEFVANPPAGLLRASGDGDPLS